MIRTVLIVFVLSISVLNCFGQDKIIVAPFFIESNDTLFIAEVLEVKVLEFKNNEDRRHYYMLKRRVFKVYPYALVAKERLKAIKSGLDTIPKKRHKKRYTKEVARWVKEEYSEQLKNLTMSEGKILVKLIYRETHSTSYELVRSYRGKFNAFFWQTMAKLWDNDLKATYDPVNVAEDMLIEHMLLQAKIEGKLE